MLSQSPTWDLMVRVMTSPKETTSSAPSNLLRHKTPARRRYSDSSTPPSRRCRGCFRTSSSRPRAVDSEALLAEAIEEDTPDVLFLEEVWIQENCGDDQRPGAVNDEPYVCSLGSQPQTERLLPEGYRWGCAAGYPDNCIGFKSDVFHPDDEAACDGRNCSAAVVSMAAPDSRDGRIAYLTGTSAAGPTILVVVHTNAGIEASDTARRASQLGALKDVLLAAGEETTLFIAGDFNLDPTEGLGQDANALRDMADELGLVRVPDDGYTHRMINGDLDVVLARGWTPADNATCHVRFLDEGAETPMFDHAFLLCH